MSTYSGRVSEQESQRGTAGIGKSVVLKGQVYSREDLYIDGEVDGTLELLEHRLTIGPHGKVHAAIKAREVVIVGAVQGNIEASDKIDIRKDARLVGDIKTARIVIEDGAYFKGSIDIQRPEVNRAAVLPKPPATASAAAQPAVSAGGTSAQPGPATPPDVKR